MARRAVATARSLGGGSYVEWSAVIAGAIGASAISWLLLTFGGAIGLSLTSPLPHEGGLGAWGVMFAVLWWAVMVQIGSFFAGGYLAGRMRAPIGDGGDETAFRDSAHGFLVWAVGVLMIVFMAAGIGGAALKTASQSVSAFAGAATTSDKGGVSTADYAADLLLRRTATGPAGQAGATTDSQREEVKRIFTNTIANAELSARDRDYLAQIVAARNGVSPDDARSRVDQAVQETQRYEIKAREAANKARKAGVLSGFLAAASLLISLAAAVGGAALGGAHRDSGTVANLFGTRFW
jgi:hypothetical protein